MGASGGKSNIQKEISLKQSQNKEPEILFTITSKLKYPLPLIKDHSKNIITTKTLLMVISKKLIYLKNKKLTEILKKRNEIVELIRNNQLETAKFKTEFLMRDEDMVKAYEIISIVCTSAVELVYSVFHNSTKNEQELGNNNVNENYLKKELDQNFTFHEAVLKGKIDTDNNKNKKNNKNSSIKKKSTITILLPPEDTRHYIDTIIYCSTRINIDDFNSLREIFNENFGNFYVRNAASNAYGHVKEEIVKTLSLYPYTNYQIIERLNQIAEEEKIQVNFTENFENNFTINSHE
jgi:hypothetical protein